MTAAPDWARVKQLFQAALDQDEAARANFVASQAGDDQALRDEVLAMLAAHGSAATLRRGEARDLLGDDATHPALPARIGPFCPVALVGRGGMGVVYRAERDVDGGTQTVALKLIAAGFADAALVRRFERERAILARLQHPNIAHFIDGGLTADGSPWLAMQFVSGCDLLRFSDARRLSLRARVQLYLQVVGAVAFAHRNLIVHRDLKPSNIVVDEHGTVRLLDFGIAKLVDEVDATALTQHGVSPMTPDYAAPEQLLGEAVTTATDVHALGVVLFELLSGRLPFASSRRDIGAATTREPRRLREAVFQRGGAEGRRSSPVEELAQLRSLSVPELRRALDTDLERIIAISLARHPGDRYPSAEAMAADLQAWLDDRPLLSRPSPWHEQLRKFARRHRLGVAVAGALLVVTAAGVGATLWQAERAQEQAKRAESARRVLSELFQAADPQALNGREMSARELVDQGAARLRGDAGIEPDLRAALLTDLGSVYHSLGAFKQARALLAGIESTPGVRAETLSAARLLAAEVAVADGDYDGAERISAQLRAGRADAGPLDPLLIELDLLDARIARERIDVPRATALAESLLQRLPADDPGFANARAATHDLLGQLAGERKAYEQAHQHLRASLRESEAAGASATAITSIRHEIARMLSLAERFDEALPEFEYALAQHTRVLGADHPLSLSTKGEMAEMLKRMQRFDDANRLFLEVIEAKRRTLGPEHDDYAVALLNYGALRYLRDEFAEALPYFEEAARIWTKTFGIDGDRTLTARDAAAGSRAELGDVERAIAEMRSVVAARERNGENDSLTSSLNTYGIVLDRAGRLDESCAQFRRAIEITGRLLPDQPEQSRWTRALLGRCLRRSGDFAAAERELRWARASFLKAFPAGPRVALIDVELARTLRAAGGDEAEIEALYAEAVRLRQEKLDRGHPKIAEAEREYAAFRSGAALPAGL
jgi:serine/threonine-protein kinase